MKSIFNGIQWRELVAWLPVLGLLMVLSALPFGWSDYQRIGIYVLGIGYVADYSCNQRWKQFSWSRGKWIYVVNKEGNKAVKREIRIGRQNPQYYEVLEGLEPGEKVITSGYDTYGDSDVLVF